MPTIEVDVSDELAMRIERTGIVVSDVCQHALADEVRRREARPAPTAAPTSMDPGTVRPDDMARESAGHAAGRHWASTVASSHEVAAMMATGNVGVAVSREQEDLCDILARAGLRADSETNRVLSDDDPWARGFLRACRERWEELQPLL
jgi:hypothetical protein